MRRGGERETSLMMGWVRGAHKLGSESKSAIEAGEQIRGRASWSRRPASPMTRRWSVARPSGHVVERATCVLSSGEGSWDRGG